MKKKHPAIKVCGLMRQSDLDCVEKRGFCMAGFIFAAQSPRWVTPEQAAALVSRSVTRVGVFCDTPPEEILETARIARLDAVQLHGDYSPEVCCFLRKYQVIKVLWPESYNDAKAFGSDLERYAPVADLFLFDAGKSGGGQGRIFPWDIVRGLPVPLPWLLAGGISPANAAAAWSSSGAQCLGLDCNSGVERSPGIKEELLLQALADIFNDNCEESDEA